MSIKTQILKYIMVSIILLGCGMTREDCYEDLAMNRLSCEEGFFSYIVFLKFSNPSDPNFQRLNEERKALDLLLCNDYLDKQKQCDSNRFSVGNGNNPRDPSRRPPIIRY